MIDLFIQTPHTALALVLVLASCAGGEGSTPDLAASSTSTSTSTASDATGEAASAGATSSGSTEPEGVVPCTAIDFLFVVDNSSTMADEQIRLGAAAPEFIAAVLGNLPAVEVVHVGVISTDTSSLAVSAGRCGPYASGLGFMTQDDDLTSTLGCAVTVGAGGNPDERPMDMLVAAIDDLANQPGGLNSDFVRKPSLLVLVLVTDEEDDHEADLAWGSDGEPPEWFDRVTAVKGGLAGDFVVLSLVGVPGPNACPPVPWDGKEGAELAPRLAEFTGMFPFGRVGDVCAPSYDGFFFDAVPTVAQACAGFIPVE